MQPEGHFKTMVAVLKKFLHFMKMTATVRCGFVWWWVRQKDDWGLNRNQPERNSTNQFDVCCIVNWFGFIFVDWFRDNGVNYY